MIRWLAFLALAAGLAVGVAYPRPVEGNLTGYTLAVSLTPPTLNPGLSPTLTCGWHVGCYSPWTQGYALDWDDENQNNGNPWHFRGFFYVSNTSRLAFRMFPLYYSGGPFDCDVRTVWISEIHSGQLMAIPTFMHVTISNNASFDWWGSQWTTYNSRQIGTTILDEGCSGASSHVHEYHFDYPTSSAIITRNTGYYPTSYNCHGTCNTHKNNDINKWTRSWQWQEGASPH